MKTRNLLLGLGLAAGAFVTVAALRRKNAKAVKEYVSKGLKKVSIKKKKEEKEPTYV